MTIAYDATSAAGVAAGDFATEVERNLARQAVAAGALARSRGNTLVQVHVQSHTGVPGNELVDCLASFVYGHGSSIGIQEPGIFDAIVGEGLLEWMWMLWESKGSVRFPVTQENGAFTSMTHAFDADACYTCPAELQAGKDNEAGGSANDGWFEVSMRLVTYNTLSLISKGQHEALEHEMRRHKVHILGLQECREAVEPIRFKDGICKIAGPVEDGNLGCQVWIDCTQRIATAKDGSDITWQRQSFTLLHSSSRILVVGAQAGQRRFALIVAHARTQVSSRGAQEAFWSQLSLVVRDVPRGLVPIWFIDANARFECETMLPVKHDYNASRLQDLVKEHALALSRNTDESGRPLVTWIHPGGASDGACVDYIALPEAWVAGIHVTDRLELLDAHAGFDHFPLTVDLSAWIKLGGAARQERIDVEQLGTDEGRKKVERVLATVPAMAWHVGAAINKHVFEACVKEFPRSKRPRNPALSQHSWALIAERRQARRISTRAKRIAGKILIDAGFRAWRGCLRQPGHEGAQDRRASVRLAKLCYMRARVAKILVTFHRDLRISVRKDAAEFTRRMVEQARSEGSRTLSNLLRAVLKTGRRYRAPSLSPCVMVEGECVENPRRVRLELGRFFADAERAQEVDFSEVVRSGVESMLDGTIDIEGFPSLAHTAEAFAAMKSRKAPGVSGIPADVFKSCPVAAARVHAPIYLKILARGRAPVIWRGCLIAAVPKPGKPLTQLSGYRSVALQEPALKAWTKAMRGSLEAAVSASAPPGLSGGRKGWPMTVTAATVQAHVDRLKKGHISGAVLFLDGVSAFYSTARCFLFGNRGEGDVNGWINSLPISSGLREKLVLLLKGPTQLERMQVAQSIREALRSTFTATWFATVLDDRKVFRTSAGTIPGSPLADILFQAVMIVAVDAMLGVLEDEGLRVTLRPAFVSAGDVVTAPVPTWLDDVAVLLESPDAWQLQTVVPKAAAVAYECLQIIGVSLNFQPGKTEAIVHFAGRAARLAKHNLLVEKGSCIQVRLVEGDVWLRCVHSYVHLGTTASFDGHHAADVKRRRKLTEAAFVPLYKRLLFNPGLSQLEKQRLIQSLVLNKFCHGSGLWQLDAKVAWQEYKAAYMSFVRRAMRPLAGCTSKLLNDAQALVGVLSPADALHVARFRQLFEIAASKLSYVWVTLVQARSWLDAAAASVARVNKVIGGSQLETVPDDECDRMRWFRNCVADGMRRELGLLCDVSEGLACGKAKR